MIGLGGVTLIHTGHAHHRYRLEPELAGSGLAEVAEQRSGHVHYYANGQTFPLSECCPLDLPEFGAGLSPQVWQQALEVQQQLEQRLQAENQKVDEKSIPGEIRSLVDERQAARARKDWAASDALRGQIEALGWQVKDTPEGPVVERIKSLIDKNVLKILGGPWPGCTWATKPSRNIMC